MAIANAPVTPRMQTGKQNRSVLQAAETLKKPAVPWYASAIFLSALSGLLLWGAFPPLNLALLAWLAPLGWLVLIRREKLGGKWPYAGVWIAGFAYWLVLLQFVRLAHWAAYFGWIALGLYLSLYPVLFVGLSRVAVHRLRLPLLLAAPIVWTGLELLRGFLFTGFSVALLGHTQVSFPAMIQIADLGGGYAVSFVVMLGAACLATMLPLAAEKSAAPRWRFWPAIPLVGAVIVTLAYGSYRLNETPPGAEGSVLRVALIQGCYPTHFDSTAEQARQNFDDYLDQSVKACKEHQNLDLVIWPESMFSSTEPDLVINGPIEPPAGVENTERFEEIARSYLAAFKDKSLFASKRINGIKGKWELPNKTQLLVGCETQELGPHRPRRYNSALLIDDNGQVSGRYYKMHCVMFGEYVPLGDWFPWLYTLTPMPEGLTPGQTPSEFDVAGFRLAPSICFESTVPHLIRRQMRTLEEDGAAPDILVNVTNDGWFWGSSALDMHLTCGVFRSVEQRRPMVIAANTGFSAVIDGNGQVRDRGPRFAKGTLVADVTADGRQSMYQWLGDLPAWACALVVCLTAVVGLAARFRRE